MRYTSNAYFRVASLLAAILALPATAEAQLRPRTRAPMDVRPAPVNPMRQLPLGPAPTKVSATATSPSSVAIGWEPTSGSLGYTVLRTLNPSGQWTVISPFRITATTFTDRVAPPKTTLYYQVVSDYAALAQNSSATVSVTTPPPVNPTGFTATVNGKDVALKWDAMPGAWFYWLYGTGLSERRVSATSYALNNVQPGTYYYYVVANYDSALVNADGQNPSGAMAKIRPDVITTVAEQDFGGGKHATSNVSLDRSGRLTALTETWTNSPFQGFAEGVWIYGVDDEGGVHIGATAGPYGVDGNWVPFGSASRRIDSFTQQFEADSAARVTQLRVLLLFAPQWRIVEIIHKTSVVVHDITEAIKQFCDQNADLCKYAATALAPAPPVPTSPK